MIKVDKSKFPVYFCLVSKSGILKHCFCILDFEAVDCCIDVAYYDKIITSKIFVIVDYDKFKFALFLKNYIYYFNEVPTTDTLKKMQGEFLI